MRSTRQEMTYDGGDVPQWQRRFRRKLAELMGYDFAAKKVNLNVRSLWKKKHELGTIEKIVFTSEPGADVPAYVCLPKDVAPPYKFMICLQGHSTGMHVSVGFEYQNENKSVKPEGDRDFAIGCLHRGVAALCIEQRSFGERREWTQKLVSSQTCHDAVMQGLLLGRTLTAQRVFDVDRGIDYIELRGDADMRYVGVMGNSGGGTITVYSGALLPRVKLAMPSCAFCTFADSILAIYHCGDNYIPSLYRCAEMADVLGLFAPKPVVVVAGRHDKIFPLQGVRKAFNHLKRIYKAAGAPNNCRLVIGEGDHRYYANESWPSMLKYMKQIE